MKLHICGTATEAANAAAFLVAEQLRRKPDSVLGLATGLTLGRMPTR